MQLQRDEQHADAEGIRVPELVDAEHAQRVQHTDDGAQYDADHERVTPPVVRAQREVE